MKCIEIKLHDILFGSQTKHLSGLLHNKPMSYLNRLIQVKPAQNHQLGEVSGIKAPTHIVTRRN
ncbi:hypothetical protein HMPREF9591_00729 [Cutibacterium acnes HL086PA1]|jgi:hypothetical protein|uniref:hypothetical protein n=1 Tax=Streptomyces sp. AS02 TaxID=2938946 RepID=UPI0001EF3873|nr:hypothetical protein [Streptomyces sp. AS02]EFS77304.1 hypothetical protein HMPREF9591_00729 [Cutibacterium acnes HL086PA1]MCL8018210.1 hypothetical protein [Streptomyces sp. AS02]